MSNMGDIADKDYSARLERAQLVALNRQGRVTNFVPPINSLILVGMLWGRESPALLLGWAGLVWASSLLRVILYRQFDGIVSNRSDYADRWRWIWVAVYALSGVIWGVGSVLMFPQDSFLIQAFLMLFILGTGAGGTAAFAPYFPALVAYIIPLILPIVGLLALQDSGPHNILAAAGFVFLLALYFLGRTGSRSFAASFRLSFENEALAEKLTAAQARLDGALDSMSEAFALFDADERLVTCNDKFDALLPDIRDDLISGISFEAFFDLLGRTGRVADSTGRAEAWARETVRRCRDGELPIEIELSDGQWLMLNHAATADGGVVATFADISELKRHQVEVSESEQRFRDFTSAASDWAWESDAETRFTHVSGRYAEVSGRASESLIGERILDLPSLQHKGDWERFVAAIAARQPFRNIRLVRPREDGDVFHFVLNGLPIFGSDGAFLGYRGTGSDVSATVRAESRAKLAQAQLFEALESIPAGFVLFDTQGRLTLWNSRAPLYMPGAKDRIVSGSRFETLMRSSAESGAIHDANGRVEEWLTEQNNWFLEPETRREVRFTDGRYVQLLGGHTADGGTVCVITDITDIRRGQEELAEKTTFLQATLEGMGEGLVVLDSNHRAVLSNTRLDRLAVLSKGGSTHGLELETILEVIGAEPVAMSGTSNGQAPLEALKGRLSDGVPFQFEVERIGRQVLMVRADPLPEGGWVCVFTDVTAERRALSALEESEDRYRRLTEASPDMIAVHTRGRFVFVNAAGAHLLGVTSADELLGRRLLDFVHPDDHETARNSPPMSSFDDQIEFKEFVALRSDGRSFQAEALGTEFLYQGEPSILVIWRDITDRKLAQAQLVQTSKLALLGEMAASMAHELNQPLNIIRMAADSSLILMEEDKADEESHREEFERISNQTERMANIINHLRVFSRQDDSSESFFDPIASVGAAAAMVRDQYLLDGVDVRTVLPKRTASVRGQPIRLEQVVLNLLANARDAVRTHAREMDGGDMAGGDKGIVEVSAFVAENLNQQGGRQRPDEVVITVSDNGGGLPSDVMDRVFEPFFTTKDVGEGTGLGLAIGYSIIAAMGGAITAANTAKGAMFEIRLPVAAEADDGAEVDEQRAGG